MSMSALSAPGNPESLFDGDTPVKGVIRVTGAFPVLEVKDRGGYQSRHKATLDILREAFQTYAADLQGLHFDFFIGSFDNPESCNVLAEIVPHVLTYSVTDQCRPNILAIPDFVYGGWPEAGIASYTETATAMREAGKQPPLHDKVFWIGNAGVDPSRAQLLEIGAQHPDDMECIGMSWSPGSTQGERLPASRFVSLPDHAAYSMLLDIRGAGYSGRFKLLMQAGRPVLKVENRFREFFSEHLRPFEHYMPVKEDLSDLVERVREVKCDKALAEKLGKGASTFAAHYLTRDYALSYWRDLLLNIGQRN
jgi:Glycosyl transferase family 90